MYNIAIFCGGKSLESDISVVSALSLAKVLKLNRRDFIFIYGDKDGSFYKYDGECDVSSFCQYKKFKKGTFERNKNDNFFKCGLKKYKFDIVVPIVHGKGTEDGSIKAFFDTLDIPCIGNSLYVSSLVQNKNLFKKWAVKMKYPTMRYYVVRKDKYENDNSFLKQSFKYPVIVKPCCLGSSIAINKVESETELIEALDEAFKYDSEAIVEKWCEGLIEYNIAVIKKNNSLILSDIVEVNDEDKVLSFEEKYIDSASVREKYMTDNIRSNIIIIASKAYEELNLVGPVRFDFMYSKEEKKLYLNEINIIPGSLSFNLFESVGISKYEIADIMIEEGINRYQQDKNLKLKYEKSSLSRLSKVSKFKK